ncbi:MAG: IS200/IS605 family transposase [Muribaculaceae bacterium]|nr:IS200/IS605 family transposase [Muribaculaceae bacterium]
MSKTLSLHHIVFATAHRFPLIPESHKRDLYSYIFGILKNKKCYVYRINGMRDHIHILIDLNPSVALADLVRDIKRNSSLWMSENELYPHNSNWGKGYYAVSLGRDGLDACIEYIKNQEIHHRGRDFMAEAEDLAAQNGLTWYADDWK